MKHNVFLIAVLLLAGCCGNWQQEPTCRQIGMEEAISVKEEDTDYIILDVRRPNVP